MAEEGRIIHATGSAEVSTGLECRMLVNSFSRLFLVCVRMVGTLDRLTRMQRDVWLEFWLVRKRGSCLADEELRQGWRAMVIIR